MNTIFRLWSLLLLTLLLLSCAVSTQQSAAPFPSGDRLSLTWEILNDAVRDADVRTAVFTLTNHSDTIFPSQGWQLFYSQFPNVIESVPGTEDLYQVKNIGGDLYAIEPGDSFPTLSNGQSVSIEYRAPYPFVKKTHGPQNPYISVQTDRRKISIDRYLIKDFPNDFSFAGADGQKSIFISPQDRFNKNAATADIPLESLAPIIPTPFSWSRSGQYFTITTNINLEYDALLEAEAEHLSEFLGEVLQRPLRSPDNRDTVNLRLKIQPITVGDRSEGCYELSVTTNGIEILGSDPMGVFYGIQSLKLLVPAGSLAVPTENIIIPTIEIKDAPRFDYRGLMLDIARNHQPLEVLHKVIKTMALYKMNKLHLHLTDDEGWRLAIPDLPELTEVGARRGADFEEGEMLPPAYGSGPNADTMRQYLTREEFIDLLKFAKNHHIDVIPEINGPGHARAAIKAMEYRYQNLMEEGKETEARQYLLHDLNDKSEYASAQNYHDNVMCVCQEYTYTFINKVLSEVVKMYEEAGATLDMVHTGGDEVPAGAWSASPECERLIKDESSLNSTDDLFPYFVTRYAQIAQQYDLRISGWEEIVMRSDPDHASEKHIPNAEMLATRAIPYVWNSTIGGGSEDLIYQLANMGFEVVMCNASNLYLDMAYDYEPAEPGLYWAGYVDTKNAFELTPFDLFKSVLTDELGNRLDGIELGRRSVKLKPEAEANIIGIQGQLWSETVNTVNSLEYMLYPKLLGVAERAWAKPPPWISAANRSQVQRSIEREWSQFANRIGKLELPRLDQLAGGYLYRIPPPGAIIKDGLLYAKTTYPGLPIRYTKDGSDPTPYSPLYAGPVPVEEGEIITLRTFTTNNRASRASEISIAPNN